MVTPKLLEAYRLFDEANGEDPNKEEFEGKSYPKELLYALRMTEMLQDFEPNASEVLLLAARCQHIRRWEISRDQYEKNRLGYLRWREELKRFHVEVASKLLVKAGYKEGIIKQVGSLLLKRKLKQNKESQCLEDVVCLVFLKFYFLPFAEKHDERKIIAILKKTWGKMSVGGQEAALNLSLPKSATDIINKALQDGKE